MEKMTLDAFFDPNGHLATPNSGLIQPHSFDNLLIENDIHNFPFMNTPSNSTTHASSMPPNTYNVDPNALFTYSTISPRAMASPLGNNGLTSNISPNHNFVIEQPFLSQNGAQIAPTNQQQKGFDNDSVAYGINKRSRLDVSEETTRARNSAQKHQIPGLIQQYMSQNRNQLEASHHGPQNQGAIIRGVNEGPQLTEDVCTRRLMQYVFHLRNKPADNNISYWRKFAAEYFAPNAKKRWCVSMYDKVGPEAISVIRQSAMSVWHCNMCGSKEGRGFEVDFDSLPRLSKLVYESGVIDELLFLDWPRAYSMPSGLMMLSYEKVAQESVYENFRVVHEGQLCIVFARNLKILSWEFCAHRHEVFVSRSSVMSQMAQAEKKYRNYTDNCRSNGIQLQDSQANRNRFQTVGGWISNALDFGLIDDLGFSKRYARCLQVAQIVQGMNDVMTFSRANQVGPIESLKHVNPEPGTFTKKLSECRDLSSDSTTTNANNISHTIKERIIKSSEEANSAMLGHANKMVPRTIKPRAPYTNIAENGLSSSSRYDSNKENRAIQKILEEMINSSQTLNESERQVIREEAETVPDNLLWRPHNLWGPGYNNNM